MSTIPVRIRHYNESTSAPLTEWPLNDLERLIKEVNAWGLIHKSLPYDSINYGQLVVDGADAYFELIFGEDEG